MSLFSKRETIVQNIAYMAIMAAINVIFVLLTAVLPPLMFLIVFILPLTSTIVTLFCKKRYFPIYFVVTIGLCLAVTSGIYIWDTFFYVLPSLVTGFIFGFMIEKQAPAIYIVLISSVIQYVFMYLTFLILDAILPEMNFIDAILLIFGLSEFAFKAIFVHIFLLVLAVIQTLFTYLVISLEVRRLGFDINLEIEYHFILEITLLVILGVALLTTYLYPPLLYVAISLATPIVIYMGLKVFLTRKTLNYLFLVGAVFAGVYIFAFCYKLVPAPLEIILLAPLYLLILIIYFGNYLFIEQKPVK